MTLFVNILNLFYYCPIKILISYYYCPIKILISYKKLGLIPFCGFSPL